MDKDTIIANLCSALAGSEHCPFEVTEEGCPRPLKDREAGFDSGMCFKNTRRSRFGAECWRLWAERKDNG